MIVAGTDSPAPASRGWRWEWLALAAVLLLTAALRINRLAEQPLWTDELYSLVSASGRDFEVTRLPRNQIIAPPPVVTDVISSEGSAAGVIRGQRLDTHPPTYPLLLRYWMRGVASGLSPTEWEWPMRLPSVAFGGLSVAALWVLLRRIGTSLTTVTLACALVAVSCQHIRMSQEARGYMLAQCLLLWGLAAWTGRGQWAAWTGAVLQAMAMGTHYLAGTCVVAVHSYWMWCRLTARTGGADGVFKARWRHVAATWLMFGLVFGPVLASQLPNVGKRNEWLKESAEGHVGRTAERLLLMPMSLIAPPSQSQQMTWEVAGAGLFLLAAAAMVRRGPPTLRLGAWMFLVPMAALVVMDFKNTATHLREPRYGFLAFPGLMLLMAGLAEWGVGPGGRIGKWAGRSVVGAVLAGALVYLPDAYTHLKEDWRVVTPFTQRHLRQDAVVVISTDEMWSWEEIMYMGLCHFGDGPFRVHAKSVILITRVNEISEADRRVIAAAPVMLFFNQSSRRLPDEWFDGRKRVAYTGVPSVGTLQVLAR